MSTNTSTSDPRMQQRVAERYRQVRNHVEELRHLFDQYIDGTVDSATLTDNQKAQLEQFPLLLSDLAELRKGRMPPPRGEDSAAGAATLTSSAARNWNVKSKQQQQQQPHSGETTSTADSNHNNHHFNGKNGGGKSTNLNTVSGDTSGGGGGVVGANVVVANSRRRKGRDRVQQQQQQKKHRQEGEDEGDFTVEVNEAEGEGDHFVKRKEEVSAEADDEDAEEQDEQDEEEAGASEGIAVADIASEDELVAILASLSDVDAREALLAEYVEWDMNEHCKAQQELSECEKKLDTANEVKKKMISGAVKRPSKVQLAQIESLPELRKSVANARKKTKKEYTRLYDGITAKLEVLLEAQEQEQLEFQRKQQEEEQEREKQAAGATAAAAEEEEARRKQIAREAAASREIGSSQDVTDECIVSTVDGENPAFDDAEAAAAAMSVAPSSTKEVSRSCAIEETFAAETREEEQEEPQEKETEDEPAEEEEKSSTPPPLPAAVVTTTPGADWSRLRYSKSKGLKLSAFAKLTRKDPKAAAATESLANNKKETHGDGAGAAKTKRGATSGEPKAKPSAVGSDNAAVVPATTVDTQLHYVRHNIDLLRSAPALPSGGDEMDKKTNPKRQQQLCGVSMRIWREWESIRQFPIPRVAVYQCGGENASITAAATNASLPMSAAAPLVEWHVDISPLDGPMAGDIVHLVLTFPQCYPFRAPQVHSAVSLPHPALMVSKDGQANALFLSTVWSPDCDVRLVLQELQTFFDAAPFERIRKALGEAAFTRAMKEARLACARYRSTCETCGCCTTSGRGVASSSSSSAVVCAGDRVYCNGPFFHVSQESDVKRRNSTGDSSEREKHEGGMEENNVGTAAETDDSKKEATTDAAEGPAEGEEEDATTKENETGSAAAAAGGGAHSGRAPRLLTGVKDGALPFNTGTACWGHLLYHHMLSPAAAGADNAASEKRQPFYVHIRARHHRKPSAASSRRNSSSADVTPFTLYLVEVPFSVVMPSVSKLEGKQQQKRVGVWMREALAGVAAAVTATTSVSSGPSVSSWFLPEKSWIEGEANACVRVVAGEEENKAAGDEEAFLCVPSTTKDAGGAAWAVVISVPEHFKGTPAVSVSVAFSTSSLSPFTCAESAIPLPPFSSHVRGAGWRRSAANGGGDDDYDDDHNIDSLMTAGMLVELPYSLDVPYAGADTTACYIPRQACFHLHDMVMPALLSESDFHHYRSLLSRRGPVPKPGDVLDHYIAGLPPGVLARLLQLGSSSATTSNSGVAFMEDLRGNTKGGGRASSLSTPVATILNNANAERFWGLRVLFIPLASSNSSDINEVYRKDVALSSSALPPREALERLQRTVAQLYRNPSASTAYHPPPSPLYMLHLLSLVLARLAKSFGLVRGTPSSSSSSGIKSNGSCDNQTAAAAEKDVIQTIAAELVRLACALGASDSGFRELCLDTTRAAEEDSEWLQGPGLFSGAPFALELSASTSVAVIHSRGNEESTASSTPENSRKADAQRQRQELELQATSLFLAAAVRTGEAADGSSAAINAVKADDGSTECVATRRQLQLIASMLGSTT